MRNIKKIALFYNNLRGFHLSKELHRKGYKITKIIAKKNCNKEILKKAKDYKIIKNLKSRKFLEFLKRKKFDLFILAGFPYIFSSKLISLPKFGIINLHGGKLPKYRGGSPLSWQIIKNEKRIGLSVIKINEKIDEGDIITESSFKNVKADTILEIQKKSFKIFNNLTLDALRILEKGGKLKKQKKSNSYFAQRSDDDSKINWNKNAMDVYNFIRAVSYPYNGAFAFFFNTKVRIYSSKISRYNPKKIKVGDLFSDNKKNFYVKCKINSIKILSSKPNINKLIFKNNRKLCVE